MTETPSRAPLITVGRLLGAVITLLTLVGFVYGAVQFVDNRIARAVTDDEFVREVALQVRPFIIFDASGTIHVDSGGMHYLESVVVDSSGINRGMRTYRIVVTPHEHLAYEPLIEPLTVELLLITCQRGPGHQFIYRAKEIMRQTGAEDPARFRLEIFR